MNSSETNYSGSRESGDGYASSQPSSASSSLETSPVISKREWPRTASDPRFSVDKRAPNVTVHAKGNDIDSFFLALTEAASSGFDQDPHSSKSPHIPSHFSLGDSVANGHHLSQPSDSADESPQTPVTPEDLNLRARITTPDGNAFMSIICPFDERVHYSPHVDVDSYSADELSESENVFSKEFAELSMVCRVLSMALDPTIPLLDRFKFICIVSHSVDEHFSKRLGSIPKLELTDLQTATINLRRQVRPKTNYEEDLTIALRTIIDKQNECLRNELLPRLAQVGVEIVPGDKLSKEEAERTTDYFKEHLRPTLTPILLDPTHPFPLLRSHDIYIYVTVFNPRTGAKKTVIFRAPSDKRLIPIDNSGLRFVTSEDVCLANIHLICQSMTIISAHLFRVTRNTKISIDEDDLDDLKDLLDFIIEEVHRRRQAPVTRLEVKSTAPREMVDRLVNKLFLDENDVYTVDTPLLDLSSCMSLAFVPLPWLRQVMKDPIVPTPFKGLQNRLLADPGAIFGVIRKQDVLVEYPRDNFENSAVLYLHAAARDPRVRSIKTVLYRGGSDSPIVAALIRAAKNGKEVSVVIELKASFDEVQNSEYAKKLQIAGCNVTYGVMRLKVHSKIMLVVRKEPNGKLRSYANISTGNFNPKTAKLYTDFSLFTCDKEICTDVLDVFNSLTGYSLNQEYRALLVAPVNMLDRFIELIRAEAANAKAGKPARIACQMNGLSDKLLTKELYDASRAGVRIDLLVRASCRLRPGIKGMSENINVYSWVGQVLQHRRLYYFHAGGKGKYFIGSADWRTRNLTGRVEVIVPIKDPQIRKRLSKAFDLIDDTKWVWRMSPDGHYFKGLPATKSPPVSVSIAPSRITEGIRGTADVSSDVDMLVLNGARPDGVRKPDSPNETIIATMADGSSNFGEDGMSSLPASISNGPTEAAKASKRGKAKRRHIVNIKGNTKSVDKVAVGAVPIRFGDSGIGIESLEVLMVARGRDDSWAVPKGGQNEGESQIQATVRIAREKAGVSSYALVANLGWIEVTKGTKQVAFQTVVLRAKELGTMVGSERRRTWMPISEAVTYSRSERGHEFTAKALARVVAFVRSSLERNGEEGVEQMFTTTPLTKSGNSSATSTPSMSVVTGSGTSALEESTRDRRNRKHHDDAEAKDVPSSEDLVEKPDP